jgi:hypothetical protein
MQICKLLHIFGAMKQLDMLKRHLEPGEVYRRANLVEWSTAVDRHLRQLLEQGALQKLSGGLYYVPRETVFGMAPADEKELVKSFLKDDHFVITSPNDYNALGVGTTQLYNERRVYNQKRHGTFKLGNRSFRFVRKQYVPAKVTKEFLLVDLMNNVKHLELKKLVHHFGTIGTKKQFALILK